MHSNIYNPSQKHIPFKRDLSLDELVEGFLASDINELSRWIIAIYRKVSAKPEVIDLINFSEEQLIEKYGTDNISNIVKISNDKRFQEFNLKMKSKKESSIPIEKSDVEQLCDELRKEGPFLVEK